MFTFTVRPDGGDEFQVTSGSRDVLAWERKTSKTSRYLLEKLPMVEMYHIAHHAAVRQGLYDGKLKDFEETCDLDFEQDEDTDPT